MRQIQKCRIPNFSILERDTLTVPLKFKSFGLFCLFSPVRYLHLSLRQRMAQKSKMVPILLPRPVVTFE